MNHKAAREAAWEGAPTQSHERCHHVGSGAAVGCSCWLSVSLSCGCLAFEAGPAGDPALGSRPINASACLERLRDLELWNAQLLSRGLSRCGNGSGAVNTNGSLPLGFSVQHETYSLCEDMRA